MKKQSDRAPTVSTVESYGTDLPQSHYQYYKEKTICGISGPIFFCSLFILISFLILIVVLSILIFPILHHKM